MKFTSAAVLTSSGLGAIPDGPQRGILPEGEPDWLILRNCALGGGGPRIDLALLHPRIGVAFVDLVAAETDAAETNAVDRFRRALDARRFPAIFGGYPPMVRVVLPVDRAAELDRLLTAAFDAEPPPALAGGDAWIGTARAAIEAELPIVAPERHLPRGRRHRALLWRMAAVAASGGVAAAVLLSVPVPPGRSPPGSPTIRPIALVGPAEAPSADPDLPSSAAPIDDGHTARDVAEALISTELPTVTKAAYAPLLPADAPTSTIVAAVEDLPDSLPMDAAGQEAALTAALSDTPETAPPEETLPGEKGTAIEVAAMPEPEDAPADTDAVIQAETPPPTATTSIAAELPAADLAPASGRAPEHVASEPPPPPPAKKTAGAYDSARPAALRASPHADIRRAALPASATARAPDAGSGAARCREILLRATMEGLLSEGDRAFLRRGCQSPRS